MIYQLALSAKIAQELLNVWLPLVHFIKLVIARALNLTNKILFSLVVILAALFAVVGCSGSPSKMHIFC